MCRLFQSTVVQFMGMLVTSMHVSITIRTMKHFLTSNIIFNVIDHHVVTFCYFFVLVFEYKFWIVLNEIVDVFPIMGRNDTV
jgi:hypothetical protein